MGRRLACPIPGYENTCIILPDEWLGKHAIQRDKTLTIIQGLKVEALEIKNAVMALSLADGWENIPGLDGKDPNGWRLEDTPLSVISWMTETVINDFNDSFVVPKNSFEPSPTA